MFTLLFFDGKTISISSEEKQKIYESLQNGKTHVLVAGGMFAMSSISAIMKTEDYKKSLGNELAKRGKFQCKHGGIHRVDDGCDCKPLPNEQPKKEGQLLLAAAESPGVLKETLAKARECIEQMNKKMGANPEKKKEIEWSHENFLASHRGLHEFSEAIKEAYVKTRL